MQKTPVNRSGIVALNEQIKALGIVSPVPVGNWLAQIKYQKLNIVRHNGGAYIAKTSSINVEPGVAQNWQDVWLLLVIDGGSVSPDGTYPEMSAGKAFSINKIQIVLSTSQWQNNSITLTSATYPDLGNVTSNNIPYFIAEDESAEAVVTNNLSVSLDSNNNVIITCQSTPTSNITGNIIFL